MGNISFAAETEELDLDLLDLGLEETAEEYHFPEIEPEAMLFLGYRFIDVDGSEKSFEYEYLDDYPVFGGELRSFKYPHYLHFDADFKNEKDYAADLRYSFKSLARFRWFNSTLFHNLENIQLIDIDPATDPGIVIRDSGKNYGVKTSFNHINVVYNVPNYPMHAYIKGFFRTRKGDQQQRSIYGSGWHFPNLERLTQSRSIDWKTQDITFGINAHLGMLEADYSHREVRFDVSADSVLYDTYTAAGGGGSVRPAGTYPHNLIAELESSSDTIKLHTSFTGRLVATATLTQKDANNRDSGASTDIFYGSGSVSWFPKNNLAFFLKYAHREIDRTNPSIAFIPDIATGNIITYTGVRPSISSKTDTVSLKGRYKPLPKLTVKAAYTFNQKERTNTTSDQTDATRWRMVVPKTKKNSISVSADSRLIKDVEMRGEYTYVDVSNPSYNTEPSHSNRGTASLTWTPSAKASLFATYTISKDKRTDLNYVDAPEPDKREVRTDNLLASGTFLLTDSISFTPSYSYMRYKITQDIEGHNFDGTVTLTDFGVPYEEKSHVYSASLNIMPTDNINLLTEVLYTKSTSSFRTNSLNTLSPVPIETFSKQEIKDTAYRLVADYSCMKTASCIIELEYHDFDDARDNIFDDNYDGDGYIILLKMMKRWE
jgi:hypothetical protein